MGFFGLLIPPQYRLAIEITILVIYTGTTVHLTAKYINNSWEAKQAEQIKAASILKTKLDSQVSDLKDNLAEAAQQNEVTKNEALEKISTLERSLRDTINTRGLRDPGRLQRCSSQTDTSSKTGVPSESGQDEHPQLSAGLSEFLLREFTAAQTVTVDREQCYDDYASTIDQVNAYADKVEGAKK